MNSKIIYSFFIIAAVLAAPLARGEATVLTLDQCIARARSLSVDATVARNELTAAYWEYRSYRADRLPEVTFTSTLPAYRKQYSSYMNGDGEYSFVRNNFLEIDGQLSVSQTILPTGGTIALNTSLDFLRQLDGTPYSRYMSVPVSLSLKQPIFGVNTAKWDSRIEPVRYREAQAAYLTATEQVAMAAINRFFNLLLAIENESIATQNLANAVKLHEVAREKRKLGEISKNDLLQMELNELQARSELTACVSNRRSAMFDLRLFLDLGDDVELVPEVPGNVPDIMPSYADILDKALERNKLATNLRRRQLEADYEVAKAKGAMREINLFASVGYTGTDHSFRGVYDRLRDNQVVEVGVSIPLLDWGKRRGRVRVAESNRQVTEARLRQERMAFTQDLFVLTERFTNQREQLRIAVRSDSIASRRYDTNVQTYLIGQISTLDLNDSQTSKDQARRQYINELFSYWYYFYQLRSLTLWDYERNRPIEADFEAVATGRS